MKKITIAIDGYSSCGKSTMAKDLAREIGYIYIDSGAMYRAVTLYCLDNGLFTDSGIREEELRNSLPDIRISFRLNPETQRPVTLLNGEEVEERIRTMEVSSHVSPVAALGFVREALVKQQQEMGRQKGIVMDGRDIGTVIMPDADCKLFVFASAEARARRRFKELAEKGQECTLEEVLRDIEERDRNDREREIAPCVPAEDAVMFDNSELDFDGTVEEALRIIREKTE